MLPELKERLKRVPPWWADAKLGIFVHWTPSSVPGFAPTDHEIGELVASDAPHPLAEVPYSEWYENSLRFADSSVARFHRDTYGDRPYEAFADDFVAGLDQWDPHDWARRFAAAGARYVVLVAKHHDGWCLWPSEVPNPHRRGWFSRRDLVGELAEAVRNEGLRFGVYYSGGLDWTFEQWPIGTPGDALAAAPRGDYASYADAQVRELIDRYQPSVLWNDISWPDTQRSLERLFVHYYERVPDGVVNDRWAARVPGLPSTRNRAVRTAFDWAARKATQRAGGIVPPAPRFYQHRTPEYVVFDRIRATPWEMVRGMDKGFGYNRTSTETDFLTRDDLIRSLVDITAKGGNLLLNVGPRGEDAQIPAEQVARLDWLGAWMDGAATALRGTRPWIRPSDRTPEGYEVRYTATGDRVWALCWNDAVDPPDTITLPFTVGPGTAVSTTGGDQLKATPVRRGMRIDLVSELDSSAFVLAVDGSVAAATSP
jgi:alpha-L-fucosidase